MLKSILRTAAVAASFSMVSLSAGALPVQAETLPIANEMFAKMGFGINIGNTMEVPVNPTWWGNKFPTEAYIDSIKAAGFSTVRIPCAWYSHSNAMSRDSSKADIVPGGGPNEIAASWMDSVQTVVDMCMRAGLVTILNIHWDNGWLEGKLNDTDKDAVNARQKDFWTQIASHFKNYNENLLFASANEPATTDANYKHETEILMTYHQTFVDAVRATGGNNGSRTLIIQGPSTSIDRSSEVMPVDKLPKDVIENRLMVEVHFYDPYTYTLLNDVVDWGAQVYPQYYWGTEDLATGEDIVHNCGYNAWGGGMGDPCTSAQIQDQFGKMKKNFVDKGVPVIIGEFGANDRVGVLTGDKYAKHRKGRLAYYDAVMKLAKENKVVPIAWDTGHEGENNMTIIRRQTEPDGSVFDMDILNIMRHAYGLADYVNNGITHIEDFGGTSKIAAAKSVRANLGSIVRVGNRLESDGEMALFDMNGALVRRGTRSLSLENLPLGIYFAKGQGSLVKVDVR